MAYRTYFMKIKRSVVDEVKDMAHEQLVKRFMPETEQDDLSLRYLPICQIFELGQLTDKDTAKRIYEKGVPLFNRKGVQDGQEEYAPYVVGKEGLLELINVFQEKITRFYEDLKVDDGEFDYPSLTAERKQELHINKMIRNWKNGNPVDLDANSDRIVRSWDYEYQIFELVRILKTFDFEKDTIVVMGW